VLLSIREDAWAKLDRFEGHIPLLFANYIRVDHLDLDAAREAIEEPIEAWNRTLPKGAEPYAIEPALVEEVLAAAGAGLTLAAGTEDATAPTPLGDRIEAPFLQLVLERLWRATVADGDRVLTRATLEALGGARQIVENHLLQALGRLTPPEQDAASDCFRFLVSSSKTKIAHPAADLAEWTRRPESQVTTVLDKLCTAESGRILRAIPAAPDQPPGVSYELFHDLLAEPILAWRRVHEQERARRAVRRRLMRVGGFALGLILVFAGLSVWALVERGHANTLFHKQKATSQKLSALNQVQKEASQALRKRLRALDRETRRTAVRAKAQRARVKRLRGENRLLTADVGRLRSTRTVLDREIKALRAQNRRLVADIARFNAENRALARKINRLDASFERLTNQLEDAQATGRSLVGDADILKTEAAALKRQLHTLNARNTELRRKASELGLIRKRGVAASAPGALKGLRRRPPEAARVVSVPPFLPGSDRLRRRVERLERQLARLLEQRSRLADEAKWLRRDNQVLAQQRAALRAEIAQLRATQAALAARNRTLHEKLGVAKAEHVRLASKAAAREARNGKTRTALTAARRANATQQRRNSAQVESIGVTRADIEDVRGDNRTLLEFIVPRLNKLLGGARDSSQDAELAGLLAVKAYRVTPFAPDDTAHPGVYNALWIALDRLDPKTASALIAPAANPRGKVGTTRSALLVQKICGLVKRGFTRAEWIRFLPDAQYTSTAARPCTYA
jgi:cell division protein FtsB